MDIKTTFLFLSWLPSLHETLHKKQSFPLTVPSVNVTKSAISCRFGHIYRETLMKNFIFCEVKDRQVLTLYCLVSTETRVLTLVVLTKPVLLPRFIRNSTHFSFLLSVY